MAVSLVLTMTASGCASGPSLKEAAAELQKDAQRLEGDKLLKNPLSKLHIFERADKDISCGNGKFKRALQATADYTRKDPDVDSHLDQAQRVMENTLIQALGYTLEHDLGQLDKTDGRLIRGAKKDLGIVVAVNVLPGSPAWRLRAETECLSR
ncbi:hypothetical protein AB0M44_22865 [Streptosporangium subroseum]|uniref:hypothetical protein n=1 Tax=Streptosporangium subroseum TaxID=106412 RepID=UPI003425D327